MAISLTMELLGGQYVRLDYSGRCPDMTNQPPQLKSICPAGGWLGGPIRWKSHLTKPQLELELKLELRLSLVKDIINPLS